jgi:flagellar biosynthesis protein FlhG
MTARSRSHDRSPKDGPRPVHPAALNRPACRSLAITSGKGGVGKTNVAANLAIALARMDRRILLVDGDLSLANLDLLLGVMPQFTVEQVISGTRDLSEVIVTTYRNVRLLPAASGVEEIANLDDFRRECFLRSLSHLDAETDLIVIDTGSGLSRNVTSLALAADEILVVTTPEPTAVSQAYAMIKVLATYRQTPPLKILVNMASSPSEAAAVYGRICKVAEQFLKSAPESWGYIEEDPAVRRAVRNQEPFLLSAPASPAALAVERLAQCVLQMEPEPRKSLPGKTTILPLDGLRQRAG